MFALFGVCLTVVGVVENFPPGAVLILVGLTGVWVMAAYQEWTRNE
jgi:hypothetical protein